MRAAALPHHLLHLLPRIPIATSTEANNRRTSQRDVVVSMRIRLITDLRLRRSFANLSITAVDIPRSKEQPPKNPAAMATKDETPIETTLENTEKVKKAMEEKEEDKKKEKVSLPPPPEKPYPGDCCGSGCVRCVWDVYYEELEKYNKLCQSVSGESKFD